MACTLQATRRIGKQCSNFNAKNMSRVRCAWALTISAHRMRRDLCSVYIEQYISTGSKPALDVFPERRVESLACHIWINNILILRQQSEPRFTKNLKSDRIRKPIAGAKMRFAKNHNLTITSVFERD